MGKLLLVTILLLAPPLWAAEDPASWYNQARLLYQEGDREGALALLQEIPKRFPEARGVHLKAAVLMARIYFDQGKYREVVETLRPLIREAELPPEAYLLLAKAAEKMGLYDEALTFLRYLKRRYPESPQICEGNLIAARIFLNRHLEEKTRRLAQRVLSLSFCSLEEKSRAVELLLKAGEDPQKVFSFLEENPLAKRYAPEIIKALARFHLEKGEIETAEKEIFEYLNYSGKEKEAPELLYALGESYFKAGKYRAARRIFELVLTSWPYRPEALFAKFRLYQLRYLFEEKIGHKTPQTRRLLLGVCRLLKTDHPEALLTEEAWVVEIELLLEEKKFAETLEDIWAFLKKYPASPFKARVFRALCKASSPYLQGFLAKKDFQKAILFFASHEEKLFEAGCGTSFYFVAEAYLSLGLEEKARLVLLKGYSLPVTPAWAPDYRLTLVDLLLATKTEEDFKLAKEIFSKTVEKNPSLSKTPYAQFLRGKIFSREGRWVEALENFKQSYEKASDKRLQKRAGEAYLGLLLYLGRYEEAFTFLKTQKADNSLYLKILALSLLQEGRLSLAREVISFLKEKFPEDQETLWLTGLLLEKEGENQKALRVWQKVSQESGLYAELSRSLLKAAEILENSRSEIY